MSGSRLSFIWYSRLYLVQGLVITVWRLVVTTTNVCVTLSHQVCHLMTSWPSLKTSNRFILFLIFQQRWGYGVTIPMVEAVGIGGGGRVEGLGCGGKGDSNGRQRDDHWWDIVLVLVAKISYIACPPYMVESTVNQESRRSATLRMIFYATTIGRIWEYLTHCCSK